MALWGGMVFHPAQAQTWLSTPGSGDWNTGTNWDTSTVPNASSATATFGTSSATAVTNTTAYVTLGGLQFNSGASSYTLTNNSGLFVFQGAGINDASGVAQQLVNNGNLVFQNSSSAGDLTITGSGSTTFTGSSNAGAASITNSAILEFDTNATAGNATLTNQGLALFLNNSRLNNAYLVNGGSVSFGDGAATGSATIINNANMNLGGSAFFGNAHITNNSYLAFHGSAGAVGAILNNTATGTLQFYDNSLAALTSITNSGTLAFNNNSSAYTSFILNPNILDFNDSSTAGSAVIVDTGVLNFGGSSTAASASVTINGGGQAVFAPGTSGGSSNFTVNAGGLFDLSGISTGIFGIASYAQASGGTLKMALGAGTPAVLAVNGPAILGGNLDLVYGGGFSLAQGSSVTILTAGTLSGLFDQWNNPQGGRLFPFYSSISGVYLESVLPSFQITGLTANETAVAQALDSSFEDRNRYNLVASLVNQSAASLPTLYAEMDPAGLTSFYQMGFRATHAWTGVVFRNLQQEAEMPGDASPQARRATSTWFAADLPAAQEKTMAAQAAPMDDWKVSLDSYGDFGTVTGDGNSQGYRFTVDGLMAGAQYRLSGDWTAGICLGYGEGNANPDSGGEEDINGGEAGLFVAWHDGGFHAEALAGAGLNQIKVQRPGYGGTALANASGEDYTGRIGLGYNFRLDELKVKPFASAEYTYMQLDTFNESGSLAPLSFSAQGEGALLSDLGFSVGQDIPWGTALLTPGLTGAWEHAYQSNPDGLTAGLGGSAETFTVQGPVTGQDAVVLGAHLEAAFKNFATFYGDYHGRIGLVNYAEQGFELGAKAAF